MKERENNYEAICIHVNKEYRFLQPEDIVYVKADGNYVHLFLINDEALMISRKIKDVEAQLPEELFVRVHNTYIVNLIYVTKYLGDDTSEIELANKTRIPISRRRKSQLMTRFTRL